MPKPFTPPTAAAPNRLNGRPATPLTLAADMDDRAEQFLLEALASALQDDDGAGNDVSPASSALRGPRADYQPPACLLLAMAALGDARTTAAIDDARQLAAGQAGHTTSRRPDTH